MKLWHSFRFGPPCNTKYFPMSSCLLMIGIHLYKQLTTGHRVALSTIGYVGCSISIFCLAITLVTFAVLSWVSIRQLFWEAFKHSHHAPNIVITFKFMLSFCCRSVSTMRNQRYHIHANLSFAILVAEILLLISARFDPGTVRSGSKKHVIFFVLILKAWFIYFFNPSSSCLVR